MTTRKTAVPGTKAIAKKTATPKKATAKPAAGKAAGAGKESAAKPVITLISKRAKKEHKKKVVRDSFTMPHDEYQQIAEIKAVCAKAKLHVKKSEVLRAGLKLLAGLSDAQMKQELGRLEKIKTGRPKKH
ncbi:MAG TPA: hypothetical protein VGD24_08220 [Gallionella sp.]